MEGSNPCEEVAKTEVSNVSKPVVPIVPDVITNLPALSSASNPPAVSAPANVPAASEAPTVPPASTPVHVPPADTSTDAVVSTPSSANPCTVPKTAPAPTPSKPADSKHTPTPAVKPVVTPQQSNARATSLPSAASEASVKNRSSRDEKARKKDDKSMDHVLRALHSLSTPEEKLAALCQKYSDLFDEHRKLQALQKQTEKRCSMLQREKEQLTGEHSKAILTRSRLENLCRELQRQNKAIKDESLLKIREEEEKRKDVSAKFQTTMNEITSLMQQNNDKNMKLRDDNIDMTAKLKSICEQYELRQQQVDRISKQMQLEQQLADAKLSKLKLEMAAERETLLKEKQQLLMELQQYQQRCNEFQGTEVNLRNQISMYNDKYDEFQKALARSNDVFGGFKGEMEKMSKKICKLEKETSSWKQRWERSHRALLEMAADKQKSEQELGVVSRQLATLQGLCRTLQTERATLTAKLKLLQAGGQDCSEVADIQPSQQSEQTVNNLEPVTPSGQPMCVQGLNSWTKEDVLASLINSCPPLPIESNDTSQPISGIPIPDIKTLSAPNPGASTPVVPTPSTPSVNSLPNVVGASSVCPVDQTPEVNSDLTKQFQNITVNEIVSLSEEKHSPSQENVLETGVSEETQVYSVGSSITEVSNQPVIAEKPNDNSTAVLNGDAQTTVVNGLPTSLQKDVETPLNQLSPAVKDSPTKSPETGKKSKESAKKKKK